jgi:hypothetical protein
LNTGELSSRTIRESESARQSYCQIRARILAKV